jgi:mono/diheme cytochrome c family protein
MKNLMKFLLFIGAIAFMVSCSSGGGEENESGENTTATSDDSYKPTAATTKNIGVGPVKHVDLGPIDANKAAIGKELFEAKCTSCHKWSAEKYVGPGLIGVTKRREPEWIMNQIMVPDKMTAEDPIAKELLATYLTQMTNQNITEEQARNILEYFRQQDAATN